MPRSLPRRWRAPAAGVTLLAAFALASVVPIPSLPDAGRRAVMAEVTDRFPGWTVQRLDPSWEGGYTVVTSCAGKEVAFQFVPGHGLPAQDAWLRPSNGYARERLRTVSDHYRYLLWRADPRDLDQLSCRDELARTGDLPVQERNVD
jgi:hypothetical protein